MNWFLIIMLAHIAMSGGADEPPGLSDDNYRDIGTHQQDHEQSHIPSYKDIMMKNKSDLKKKEEEVQVIIGFKI